MASDEKSHSSKDESGEYRIISDRFSVAERRSPKPGRDYPVRAADLRRMLGTEAEAWRYLETLRFARGFFCPRCRMRREPLRDGGTLTCPACSDTQRVTDGTIFEGAPRGVEPSGWLRMLWDEAEGAAALGPDALAILLELPDPIAACTYLDRLRAVEASLIRKPLRTACDVGVGHVRVAGTLRRGERPTREVWAAIVLERASDRVRVRSLAQGHPDELAQALEEVVEAEAPLFTHLPRVSAALEAHGRTCTLLGDGEPPTGEVARRLAAWLDACPEASIDLLDGYFTAFAFRYDTQQDPPGARFYRLAVAAMRSAPAASLSD